MLYDNLSRVRQRVTVWLEPWTDERVLCTINGKLEYRQNCDSYQLVKSLYSIANGGYGGTGIGNGTFETVDGTPLIPFLQTDFVYSAIAQELGLIGAAAVLMLFLVVVARGMRIALLAQDGFSKLLAAGLTFGFALQTFIIVGGVLRVVPLTGITLPFVSYGGSSILSNFVMLALLMLVSNRAVATAGGGMNRQLLRVTWVAMAMLVALIVATTYWQTWARPGLAARQDNEIQRVAEFEIRRGLILAPNRVLARTGEKARARRSTSAGTRRGSTPRTSSATRRSHGPRRAREVAQRDPDGTDRALSDLVSQHLDKLGASRSSVTRSRRSISRDSASRSSSSGAAAARGGVRSAYRQGPRHGVVPELRPEPRREALRRDRGDHCRLHPSRAAPQPRLAGPLPPGLDFKVVTARRRWSPASSTPDSTFVDPGYCTVYGKRVNNSDTTAPSAASRSRPRSVLGQLGLLQHRQGARRQGGPRPGAKFGFYERPPLETPEGERHRSGPLPERASSATRAAREVDAGRHGVRAGAHAVTPLQMAMVAGAIGNPGIVMRPYVVEQRRLAATATTSRRDGAEALWRAVAPVTARDSRT